MDNEYVSEATLLCKNDERHVHNCLMRTKKQFGRQGMVPCKLDIRAPRLKLKPLCQPLLDFRLCPWVFHKRSLQHNTAGYYWNPQFHRSSGIVQSAVESPVVQAVAVVVHIYQHKRDELRRSDRHVRVLSVGNKKRV